MNDAIDYTKNIYDLTFKIFDEISSIIKNNNSPQQMPNNMTDIGMQSINFLLKAIENPDNFATLTADILKSNANIMQNENSPQDRRYANWDNDEYHRAIKNIYLTNSKLIKDHIKKFSDKDTYFIAFMINQMIDLLSPSNFGF